MPKKLNNHFFKEKHWRTLHRIWVGGGKVWSRDKEVVVRELLVELLTAQPNNCFRVTLTAGKYFVSSKKIVFGFLWYFGKTRIYVWWNHYTRRALDKESSSLHHLQKNLTIHQNYLKSWSPWQSKLITKPASSHKSRCKQIHKSDCMREPSDKPRPL